MTTDLLGERQHLGDRRHVVASLKKLIDGLNSELYLTMGPEYMSKLDNRSFPSR